LTTARSLPHFLTRLFLLQVEIIKAELEEKSFNKLTVIDPPEFGDYVNNRDSWGQSSTLSTTSVKHI
jgi:septin family protein